MDNDFNAIIRRHVSGATVSHGSVFDDLVSHRNLQAMSKGDREKWVIPYYMKIGNPKDRAWLDRLKSVKPEIDEKIVLQLLGEIDWRPRQVGTYLSVLMGYRHFSDIIGVHLLKSEVCCVGWLYAAVFSYYNRPETSEYLARYAGYYLTRPELEFDQSRVMEAIVYLDGINGTAVGKSFEAPWIRMQESRKILNRERYDAIRLQLQSEGRKKDAEKLSLVSETVDEKPIIGLGEIDPSALSRQVESLALNRNEFNESGWRAS